MSEGPLEPRLRDTLDLLQRALVKHPLAAQAAFSALVGEGRAYARTPEGAALRGRLEESELLLRIRTSWDVITCGMLADEPTAVLPSVLVEALARAALQERSEAHLASLASALLSNSGAV